MLDEGRKQDLQDLRHAYNNARSESERREIAQVAQSIASQPTGLSSAREALIRESRKGKVENVKDINLDIKKHYY